MKSEDYIKGYQAGYRAGKSGQCPRFPGKLKVIPDHDLSDPVQKEGYISIKETWAVNPYPEGSDQYFRFNKGCWVAWGMATDRGRFKKIDDMAICQNCGEPVEHEFEHNSREDGYQCVADPSIVWDTPKEDGRAG